MAIVDSHRPSATEPTAAMGARTFLLGIAVVVVLAAAVRLSGLTERELWFDESCTFYAVHHLLDWPTDGPDRARELAHPPYYFLLHLWTWLVGETAWGLRSFSAVLGCLGVLVIGLVGARLGGRAVGLTSAILAALHPLHIYYSQEARVYACWTVAVALAIYLLYEAARTLRTWWWVLYAVVALMTVVTHYYTVLWFPGTVAGVLVAIDRRRFLRRWLMTHVALGLALIPVAWLLIVPLSEGGPKPWLREMWLGYPPVLAVPKSVWVLLPSGGYPGYLGVLTVAAEAVSQRAGAWAGHVARWGAPAVLTGLILACIFLPSRRNRLPSIPERNRAAPDRSSSPHRERTILFPVSLGVAFLLVALLYSSVVGKGYIVGRYDFAAWPSVVIGIALLIESVANRAARAALKRTLIRTGLTAALVVCSVITIAGTRMIPVTNDLTTRARRVAATVGPDDLVISLGMYKWFMTHEWHQLGFSAEVISFPPGHDRQLCWYDAEAELADPQRIDHDVNEVTDRINGALRDGRRVWLLAHGEPSGARWQVDQQLFARFRQGGIEVWPEDEELGLAKLTLSPPVGRRATPKPD